MKSEEWETLIVEMARSRLKGRHQKSTCPHHGKMIFECKNNVALAFNHVLGILNRLEILVLV